MGRADVQFISTPKKELIAWWDQLDQDGQRQVESRIGRLLPLLKINTYSRVMQAIPHFWCPQTSTFIFGEFELTPTLEEYSIAIGMPLEAELVKPPIGIDPISELSQFLRVRAEVVDEFRHPIWLRKPASLTSLLTRSRCLGLSGATSYYPYRVARQYRALQEIPPPLKTEMFRARFTRRDYDYFDEIRAIDIAWSECRPEKIVVPKKLNEEEEIHHASTFYIHNHEFRPRVTTIGP
ncbi:hypothetical protein NL676_032470 [Syzygium grande]|nr:hypothetical protein NL676_032470 [Syzygium grande]